MNVVLGVGGGIAAYKSAELARLLQKQSLSVQVVMTTSATEFITPLTFAALTGKKVITDLFATGGAESTLSSAVEHIAVAQENRLLVVAPATADLLAKFASGLASDFLTTLYLAFTGRVILAPAMNTAMWEHPATQRNLAILRERGNQIIPPGSGELACGTIGAGRLAEPETVAAAVLDALREGTDFAGETVLLTAGPTQEPLDPVRFISNRSSGKMGYAIAAAAASRGARVLLVSGPVNLETPRGVEKIAVRTANEMRDAVMAHLEEASILVKCAAVADFRAANPAQQKMKKSAMRMTLELEPTLDILLELGRRKGDRILVGFAAETENLRQEVLRKMAAKNCDLMVGNLVSESGTGFEAEENEVLIAHRDGRVLSLDRAPKRVVARKILDEVLSSRLIHASGK